VDVEEVLKANKEKEAAAKRDRQRAHGDNNAVNNSNDDGDLSNVEVPKDRTQLANMRVIRRNLVYGVGLPPSIANEDVLRRPEYFGQYGKIAKIVLNRSQATSGDSRRASASAYVTFAQKEDTLACILALDGIFLENRNIRASYGTSKYCSAFIKNVRCNNPECTYLHEMGVPEDTFTKQEIQAGYVTSGRDVLARQQQIVAEQLKQAGSMGGIPRKRAGGGGPSGTGRSATNPVFPPPEYDEAPRASHPLVPAPQPMARSLTAGTALPPAAATVVAAAKVSRSASVGTGTRSPQLGAMPGPTPAVRTKASATTAASVVAGMHSISSKTENPGPHSTLTPLTPLKRASKPGNKSSNASVGSDDGKPEPLRNGGKRQNSRNANTTSVSAVPPSNAVPLSIGGAVIGPPMMARTNAMAPGLSNEAAAPGVSSLGGQPINMNSLGPSLSNSSLGPSLSNNSLGPSLGNNFGPSLSSSLGGEIFTGELPNSHKSMIGGGNDKWNSGHIGGATLSTGPMLGAGGGRGSWGSGVSHGQGLGPAPPGGNGGIIGSHINNADSSSALASILGINLPTGSGSLHESSNLWPLHQQPPSGPSALSSLNGTVMPMQGAIGPSSLKSGSSLIGGVAIGGRGGAMHHHGSDGGKSDIALLQSLLPGVHITTGYESQSYGLGGMGPVGGWDSAPGRPNQGLNLGGMNGNAPIGGSWTGGMSAPAGPVGAIGQNNAQQDRRQGPGIW
jgi:hypothetical protein